MTTIPALRKFVLTALVASSVRRSSVRRLVAATLAGLHPSALTRSDAAGAESILNASLPDGSANPSAE